MVGVVEEVRDVRGRRIVNMLLGMYHRMGSARGGFGGSRYFVYVVDGYWVAGAVLQSPAAWLPVFARFRLDTKRSYFLRRVTKFCPCDCLVEFLDALSERLAEEGKELLVTLGLPDHSNALYKRAGFQLVGYTAKGKRPVFVKRLR